MAERLVMIFGVVLAVIGVLGFVPGVTTDGLLLGILAVDGVSSVVYLAVGLIGIAAAKGMWLSARRYFQIFGIAYALVTVLGFVQGDSVLGIFAVNGATNVLNLVIAAVALWAGFGSKNESSVTV